jgi:hypothetical protein
MNDSKALHSISKFSASTNKTIPSMFENSKKQEKEYLFREHSLTCVTTPTLDEKSISTTPPLLQIL